MEAHHSENAGHSWTCEDNDMTNTGHGHVFRRQDGVKARCGGPGLCLECSLDLAKMVRKRAPEAGDAVFDTLFETALEAEFQSQCDRAREAT